MNVANNSRARHGRLSLTMTLLLVAGTVAGAQQFPVPRYYYPQGNAPYYSGNAAPVYYYPQAPAPRYYYPQGYAPNSSRNVAPGYDYPQDGGPPDLPPVNPGSAFPFSYSPPAAIVTPPASARASSNRYLVSQGAAPSYRSEERRVGKECRSRWS